MIKATWTCYPEMYTQFPELENFDIRFEGFYKIPNTDINKKMTAMDIHYDFYSFLKESSTEKKRAYKQYANEHRNRSKLCEIITRRLAEFEQRAIHQKLFEAEF